MKEKIWKQRIRKIGKVKNGTAIVWIAVAVIAINILWYGRQAWQWKRDVEGRVDNLEIRLGNLEQAFVSVHPEFGQRPAPAPPAPNQGQE